jgi:hypothetical protein
MSENATTFLEEAEAAASGQSNDANQPTQEGEYLQRLVGEGKKFKTIEDMAKGNHFAYDFIDQLKEEKQAMQEELDALKERQNLAQELNEKIVRLEEATKQQEVVPPELVDNLVKQSLQKVTAEQRAQEAKTLVWSKLDEFYGDRPAAAQAMKKYIGDDAEMAKTATDLGIVNPDALIQLVTTAVPKVKPEGVIPEDSDNETPKPETPLNIQYPGLTWSKCEEIRKKNPTLYKSKKFQLLMHQTAGENPNFINT